MIERVFLRKIGTICNQKKQTFCKAKKNRITDGLGDALFQNQTNFHLRINKISNKHSVKCNPTSSRLTSKIIPLKFLKILLKILRVLFFLFSWFFFSSHYTSPWLEITFGFMVFKLQENASASQKKLKADIFLHGSYHHYPSRG